MDERIVVVISVMLFMLTGGCAVTPTVRPAQSACAQPVREASSYEALKDRVIKTYGSSVPQEWGEALRGVRTGLATDQPVMALTFDACGGAHGSGYDAELIGFLEREQVPATLFMNARWIDSHRDISLALSRNPLFEIENHGLMHKPCSVTGRAAYGIPGTAGVAELVDEVELNARKIEALTGRKPRFYRPGTAYCDEIGILVVQALGYEVAGYNVLGDAGATFNREQVCNALLSAPSGAVVLLHMNHPAAATRAGVMDAIPKLKARGVRFVRLSEGNQLPKPDVTVARKTTERRTMAQ